MTGWEVQKVRAATGNVTILEGGDLEEDNEPYFIQLNGRVNTGEVIPYDNNQVHIHIGNQQVERHLLQKPTGNQWTFESSGIINAYPDIATTVWDQVYCVNAGFLMFFKGSPTQNI